MHTLFISVSYRGREAWDFPPLSSNFPPQALLASTIYFLYYFPTPRASCPLLWRLKYHDPVWNTDSCYTTQIEGLPHILPLMLAQHFWLHIFVSMCLCELVWFRKCVCFDSSLTQSLSEKKTTSLSRNGCSVMASNKEHFNLEIPPYSIIQT